MPASEEDQGTRPVVHGMFGRVVLFSGGGDATYSCGHCGTVLVQQYPAEQLAAVTMQCPACCWYNQVP